MFALHSVENFFPCRFSGKKNRPSPTYYYENKFLPQMTGDLSTPEGVVRASFERGKQLGAGTSRVVRSIPGISGFALRLPPDFVTTADDCVRGRRAFRPVNDFLPGINVGQAVARLLLPEAERDYLEVVRRQRGFPVHDWVKRTLKRNDISPGDDFKTYYELMDTLPQPAFTRLARIIRKLRRRGRAIDTLGRNVLVDPGRKQLNLVDTSFVGREKAAQSNSCEGFFRCVFQPAWATQCSVEDQGRADLREKVYRTIQKCLTAEDKVRLGGTHSTEELRRFRNFLDLLGFKGQADPLVSAFNQNELKTLPPLPPRVD